MARTRTVDPNRLRRGAHALSFSVEVDEALAAAIEAIRGGITARERLEEEVIGAARAHVDELRAQGAEIIRQAEAEAAEAKAAAARAKLAEAEAAVAKLKAELGETDSETAAAGEEF